MVSWQGMKEALEHFEAYLQEGRLVDETGRVHPPWFMVDWDIFLDGEKAAKPVTIPADGCDHRIHLYGPKGYGHVWTDVRVRPSLRIVSG